MSIQLYKQTSPPFGAFTQIDTADLGIGDMKLAVGYSHAARLEFSVVQAAHELPFTYGTFIRMWDDEGYVDDTSSSQDSGNPLFEGFVEEIEPGRETNEVRVVCYDPTYRSVRKVPLYNTAWTLSGSTPVPGIAAYPRVVFNVTQDNDDDYAYAILLEATLGQIIQQVLSDGYLPLYHINAAPGDGSAAGNDVAYNVDELGESTSGSSAWVGGLDFEPQEKVVAHSESIRSFIDRLLSQYDPSTKLVWQPGERKWRFLRVKSAPEITVTVNDPSAWHGAVLGMEIRRSVEGRYGAVKFIGPEGLEWRTAEWGDSSGDTLEPINQVLIGSSPNVGYSFNDFQITDPGFTRIANKGPYAIYVPAGYGIWANASYTIVNQLVTTYAQTWFPSLQVRYAASDGGNGDWTSVSNWRYDARSGRVWLGDGSLFRWDAANPTNKFEEPAGIRFIYPAFTEPLSVREPDSGYEGTAYTVGGLEAEMVEYDEALAVGYEYGISVTSPIRTAKYQKLATQILNARKDIIYAGGITLEGIQYDFARLNRRVNIAAKDDDGGALTTGWEDVGAIVTDVEFDFTEQTTTLQFSSDQMETIGFDPELLRQRLRIRPAQLYFFFASNVAYSYSWRTDWMGHRNLIQDTTVTVQRWSEWIDEFGELQ